MGTRGGAFVQEAPRQPAEGIPAKPSWEANNSAPTCPLGRLWWALGTEGPIPSSGHWTVHLSPRPGPGRAKLPQGTVLSEHLPEFWGPRGQ